MFALFTPALASAQQAVPYSTEFDGTQQDWMTVDKSDVLGKTWTQWSSFNLDGLGNVPTVMMQDDGYSDAPNDYYISPAITVEEGKTYAVKLHGFQQYASFHGTLSVEVGTDKDDVTTFKSIGVHTPETADNAEFNDTYKFVAEASGEIYVAFHALPYEGMGNYVYYYLLGMGIEESVPDSGGTGNGTENPNPDQSDVDTQELPFYRNFIFENASDGWTTVDKSETPGTTFAYTRVYTSDDGYSNCQAIQQDAGGGNDYLISPAFKLEAGKTYTADFTHAEYTYGGTLYLELGTDPADVSTFSPIFTASRQTDSNDNSKKIEEQYDFTVPSDGVYYLALHATNEGADESDYVYVLLKDFMLKEKENGSDEPGEDISQDAVAELPYNVDLTTDEAFGTWHTLDASSTTGSTWFENSYGYMEFDDDWNQVGNPHPCVQLTTDYDSDVNDYLVSPVFNLKEGKTYVVKVHAAASSVNTASLTLELTDNRLDASTYLYQASVETPVAYDSEDKEYEIAINKDGRYYVALHARTWEKEASANLNVFSFSIAEKEEAEDVAVDVPYTADFTKAPEGEEMWTSWTALDRSDYASTTWSWGDGTFITFDEDYMNTPTQLGSYSIAAESSNFNDYLVSPALNLEAGKTYIVTVQGFTRDYSDVKSLALELGTEKKVSGSYTKVGDVDLNVALLETDYQAVKDVVSANEVTVDESGKYYLTLHGTAEEGKNVYAYILSFDVKEKGNGPVDGINAVNAIPVDGETMVYTLDGRCAGNLSSLAKGAYIVKVKDTATGNVRSIKVVK